MKEFKIGDRVRLRGQDERGTVRRDHGTKIMVAVELDSTRGTYTYYHCELLIRLKPKVTRVPRRFWIRVSSSTLDMTPRVYGYLTEEEKNRYQGDFHEPFFEVIEVLKK